jgi:hypothetical protein
LLGVAFADLLLQLLQFEFDGCGFLGLAEVAEIDQNVAQACREKLVGVRPLLGDPTQQRDSFAIGVERLVVRARVGQREAIRQ